MHRPIIYDSTNTFQDPSMSRKSLTNNHPQKSSFKLPKINLKQQHQQSISDDLQDMDISSTKRLPPKNPQQGQPYNHNHDQNRQQKQEDILQVTKLDEWSMNKPTKKAKTMVNTHNISFLYRSSMSKKKDTRSLMGYAQGNGYQFMDVQLYLAKIDNELKKISDVNYFSIYRNMEYCSGVYENNSNNILKLIDKYEVMIREEIKVLENRLHQERQQHLEKIQGIGNKENHPYKGKINEVRQKLEEKQRELKPIKRLLGNLYQAKERVLKFCLRMGYDVRLEGLIWILRELKEIPKPDEFPKFLNSKEIEFIVTKYTNEFTKSTAHKKMDKQVCGHSINDAYEYVNRRKKRELSLIKENEEILKAYTEKIKNYSPDNHRYLDSSTLGIAEQLQKDKAKPTRYEIIYKETAKKLNRICQEKIHPQLMTKRNRELEKQNKQERELKERKRREKRNSTLIVEEFSKMLSLSMEQTKKIEDLYSSQQRQLDQILRHIRQEKYTTANKSGGGCLSVEVDPNRNPISILSCLLGWKRAEKVIEQEMLNF